MGSWYLKTAPDGWLARQSKRQAESQKQGLRATVPFSAGGERSCTL